MCCALPRRNDHARPILHGGVDGRRVPHRGPWRLFTDVHGSNEMVRGLVCIWAIWWIVGCYASHGNRDAAGGSGDASHGPPPGDVECPLADWTTPRVITELGPAYSWSRAFAVTGEGMVFVTSGRVVDTLVDGARADYLREADLRPLAGGARIDIASLAIGPDGQLYLLDRGAAENIYVSEAPHRVAFFADAVSDGFVATMIAVGLPGEALLLRGGGLLRVRPDGATLVYSEDDLLRTFCDRQWLAARGERVYWAPGCQCLDSACDRRHLYLGDVGGGPLQMLLDAERVDAVLGPERNHSALGGVAPHRAGGAIVNAGRALLCVDDEGRFAEIPTIPPFDQAWGAPIALDDSDRIYVLGATAVFLIAPAE